MSWLEDQFSEQDATNSKMKAIHRKVADKYFKDLPQPHEGKEGEQRFVYLNGIPIQFVKMNNEWHYHTYYTIGRDNRSGDGTTDSGAAITADMFVNDFMPLHPAAESNWAQLVPVVGGSTGYNDMGPDQGDWGSSTLGDWGVYDSGHEWPCIYASVASETEDSHFGGQYAVYEYNHGLNLTSVPRIVQAYVADSPDNGNYSVDGNAGSGNENCLKNPYTGGGFASIAVDQARADGFKALSLALDYWGNVGEEFFDNPVQGGTNEFNGKLRSILLAAPSYTSKQSYSFNFGNSASGQMPMNIAMAIISPNRILFSPAWTTCPRYDATDGAIDFDEYVGFQVFEWVKFKIWR